MIITKLVPEHILFSGERKTDEHAGAMLTKNNRWCLAAGTFFVLQQWHLQAVVLRNLWAVAL